MTRASGGAAGGPTGPTPADGFRVTLVRGREAVAELAPVWARLCAQDHGRLPLVGPDFLLPMRDALAPDMIPCCLVATVNGEPVGILPIGLARVPRGLVRLRRAVPFAGRHSYFTDALLGGAADIGVATALASALLDVTRNHDDLLMMRIPSDRPLGRALLSLAPAACAFELRNRIEPPHLLQGRAGPELPRRTQRLQERATTAVREVVAPADVGARFLAFADLQTRMAPTRDLDAVLADPDARAGRTTDGASRRARRCRSR